MANLHFNPVSGQLFTEDGRFLKTLSCPVSRGRRELAPDANGPDLRCASCQKTVLDTATRPAAEIVRLVESDSGVCLRVDLDQPNIRVVHKHV